MVVRSGERHPPVGRSDLHRGRKGLEELGDAQAERDTADELGWDVDERQAEAGRDRGTEIQARRGSRDTLDSAWGSVVSGKKWKRDKERFGGRLGPCRVVEVTDGDNGWHVDVHALICFARDVPAELVAARIGAFAFGRWCAALERHGRLRRTRL